VFDLTRTLDCGGRALTLDHPRIAGIINVTPDSFSDGGRFFDAASAIAHGLKLVDEGADMLDVGGESARPGAQAISAQEEIERVVPVIAALAKQVSVPIAVDTSKPEVMRAAVGVGAGFINDVYALRRDGALDAAAELKVPVCLMHMQGEPRSMQDAPHYDDVVSDVRRFLAERIFACEMSGIDKKRIVADPGFGFGKTLEHNLTLLRELDQLAALGVPLLVGLSRKATIGALTGRENHVDRAAGSASAALIAVQRGAMIVRVHDVAVTRDALAVWQGVASGIKPAAKAQKPFGSQRFGDD
jgi:dihydropteroate synthase